MDCSWGPGPSLDHGSSSSSAGACCYGAFCSDWQVSLNPVRPGTAFPPSPFSSRTWWPRSSEWQVSWGFRGGHIITLRQVGGPEVRGAPTPDIGLLILYHFIFHPKDICDTVFALRKPLQQFRLLSQKLFYLTWFVRSFHSIDSQYFFFFTWKKCWI